MLVVCKSLKNHLLISLLRCKIRYMRNIKQVYRNWPVHNLVVRPFEMAGITNASLNNVTIPEGGI
jgi:hypothetical protein